MGWLLILQLTVLSRSAIFVESKFLWRFFVVTLLFGFFCGCGSFCLLGQHFPSVEPTFYLLMNTDKGSVHKIRICFILFMTSDLKFCKHLSTCRSLFFYFNYFHSPRAHVTKFIGRLRFIHSGLRASKFTVIELIEIIILWVYYTITFGFSLFLVLLAHYFPTLETTFYWLLKDHWWGFGTRNAHMVHNFHILHFKYVHSDGIKILNTQRSESRVYHINRINVTIKTHNILTLPDYEITTTVW